MPKKTTFKSMLNSADDIYLTDKHIAVTKVSTNYDKIGNYTYIKKCKYVPRTVNTMRILNAEVGLVRKGK